MANVPLHKNLQLAISHLKLAKSSVEANSSEYKAMRECELILIGVDNEFDDKYYEGEIICQTS